MNDEQLGRDLAQDVWVMVYQRRDSYRAEGRVIALIMPDPHHVAEIELLPRADLERGSLERLLPSAGHRNHASCAYTVRRRAVTTTTLVAPQLRVLRALGVCLLLTLLIPLLNWELIFSRLIVVEDALATTRALLSHQALLRLGIVVQVLIAFGTAGVGILLYTLLKPVSPGLALFALSLRLIEAGLIGVLALLDFLALSLLNAAPALGTATVELLEGVVGVFLQGYMAAWAVSMAFFGTGAVVFFVLLRRSSFVSETFARLGVLSYALVLGMAVLTLLAPECSAHPAVQAVGYTPSVLFELLGGPWLLWSARKSQLG